jgi:hypothetical protein
VLYRECIFDKWRSYVRPRFPSLLEADRTNFADAALRALDKAIADALSHFHGRPKPGLTFGLESAHLISSTGDRERRLLGHELRLDMSTPPPGTAAVNVVTHGSNSPVNVGSGALNQHVNTAEGMTELVAALTALLAAMNQMPDLAQLNDVRDIVIEAKEEATKSKPNKLKLRVVLTGIKDSLQGIAAVQPAWEVVHRVIQMLGLGA